MDWLDPLVFYVTGVVSLVASILVVTRKNPIYSAVFLVLFFTMISLDFLILRAPFLAVIQVLVYAGAIMVLYLFVIMLLNLKPEELKEQVTRSRKIFALCASAGLFILLAYTFHYSTTVGDAPPLTGPLPESAQGIAGTGDVGPLAQELYEYHGLAFEVTSVLILIAIIGAVYLTKKRKGPAAPEEGQGEL